MMRKWQRADIGPTITTVIQAQALLQAPIRATLKNSEEKLWSALTNLIPKS